MIALVGVALVAGVLAYANGANDVSKGIATLVGSGVTSYRRAMWWGAVWTGIGALLATAVASAMLARFGSGLLGAGVTPTFAASVAAIAGASAWVLLATRTGLPVSTTHAIVGAVVGTALVAYGAHGIAWAALLSRVALPLAISPIVAIGLAYAVSRGVAGVAGPSASSAACLCVSARVPEAAAAIAGGAVVYRAAECVEVTMIRGDVETCAQAEPGALRLTADHLHWLSSGAVSVARGLNDAPKIAALVLAAAALAPGASLGPAPVFALVTLAMVAGSVIGGRRVTRMLAEDVTPMTHRAGLAANVVTAVLVTAGAVYGLPMSTTHVASGGIIGIGADRRTIEWKTVRAMALAWVVTLPGAALLGAIAYRLLVLVTA